MKPVTLVASSTTVDIIEPIDDSLEQRLYLTNFLTNYYKVAYAIGLAPAKFEITRQPGNVATCKRITWKPQRIFCALLNLLRVFEVLLNVREGWAKVSDGQMTTSPTAFFQLSAAVCGMLYKLMFVKTLWFDLDNMETLLNHILNSTCLPVRRLKIFSPSAIKAILALLFVHLVITVTVGYGVADPITTLTAFKWVTKFMERGRQLLWLGEHQVSAWNELSAFDIIICGIEVVGRFSRMSVAIFSDVFCLMSSLTFCTVASAFTSSVMKSTQEIKLPDDSTHTQNVAMSVDHLELVSMSEEHHEHTRPQSPTRSADLSSESNSENGASATQKETQTQEVPVENMQPQITTGPWISTRTTNALKNFEATKAFTEVLNTAMGSIGFWLMMEGLLYYSISLNAVYVTNNPFKTYYDAVFMIMFANIMFFASKTSREIARLKKWLEQAETKNNIGTHDLILVLSAIKDKDVGMKPKDLFTIDSGFVGKFLGFVITFFIICMQEEAAKMKQITP